MGHVLSRDRTIGRCPCELLGRRTEVRLSSRFDPRCGYELACMRGCEPGLMCVDMVGKVLRIHQTQHVFAACCGAVQAYTAGAPAPWGQGPCAHCCPSAGARPPPACLHCENRINTHPLSVYDGDRARMRTVHLCPRHMPPQHALAYVYNLRQLHAACNALAGTHALSHRRAHSRRTPVH